jgi:hypothetical protein
MANAGHETVGASLLAMTAVHSASMLADPLLSRAGSLPHGLRFLDGVKRLFLVQGLIIRRHDRSNSILKGNFPAYRGQINERYRSSQRHRHPTDRRDA